MNNEDNTDDEYEDELDYPVIFEGPCTCDHEDEEHGWQKCNVKGCNCEAHWEE